MGCHSLEQSLIARPSARLSSGEFAMSTRSSSKALSNKQSGCGGGCVIYFVFGIFTLVGAVNSYVMLFQPMTKFLAVQSWEETPCEITKSELDRFGDELSAHVEYAYTFEGKEYRCAQLRYHGHPNFDIIKSDVTDWEKRLQEGNQTVCYVDSDKPRQAVLIRDFPLEMLFGLIPLGFLGIGIGGLLIGPRMLKGAETSKRASTAWPSDADPATASERNDFVARIQSQISGGMETWIPEGQTGPQELKSNSSPLLTFLGVVLFACIWNGIVSIFVMEVISDWQAGNGSWGMTLFMTPFLLVGIGGVLAAIYYFLALFNPKVQMFVSSPSLMMGETLQAKWVLRGRLSGISDFKVKLIGEEWCQYRRGTNTYTDTSTFYYVIAVATSDPYEIESGEVEIVIPTDTMHSFDASNNKIKWTLEVHGDIKLWPDVKNKFPLVILPARAQK